jgi:hypothetical protein
MTPPTFCFDSLGFGELALKIQEMRRNHQQKATNRTRKIRQDSVSSPSSPGEALALRFQLATLCFFEWLGKSPPEELMPS